MSGSAQTASDAGLTIGKGSILSAGTVLMKSVGLCDLCRQPRPGLAQAASHSREGVSNEITNPHPPRCRHPALPGNHGGGSQQLRPATARGETRVDGSSARRPADHGRESRVLRPPLRRQQYPEGNSDARRQGRRAAADRGSRHRASAPQGPGCFTPRSANLDPDAKIAGFAQALGDANEAPYDVATFKFCYVDLDEGSKERSPDKLFTRYSNEMSAIETAYPGVSILHATMPLMAEPPAERPG